MSDDIILLSSDDEFESPPPKRLKSSIISKTLRAAVDIDLTTTFPGNDVLQKLNRLKEITAARFEGDSKKTIFKKSLTEENGITIIIEGDDKSKENENVVVNLIDESFEEEECEQKKVASTDCLIDLDSEPEDNLKTEDPEPSETSNVVEIETNGHENPEPTEPKKEENTEIVDEILNRPSTSKASDAHKLLDEFLETCAKSMKGSKYESRVLPKFQKMKKNFNKCNSIHGEPNLKKMLQEYIGTAKISAPEAVVSFQRIFSYLLDHINGESICVPEENLIKLRKLEKTCRQLMRKLKRLEAAELNFDDEEDSTYMQIDRYSQRLNKVYNKYCQLLKKNPYAGRLLYERIQFVSSQHNEINRAITKSYKHNKFPTYYDIEKCIRKCVTKNNLNLSESEIKEESKTCFSKIGNLLQMRRKKELYEVHCGFIALNEDPASKDETLKVKLQESLQESDKKMKELVEKYVKMQEGNVSVEVSEDSDDSNFKESESETEG